DGHDVFLCLRLNYCLRLKVTLAPVRTEYAESALHYEPTVHTEIGLGEKTRDIYERIGRPDIERPAGAPAGAAHLPMRCATPELRARGRRLEGDADRC